MLVYLLETLTMIALSALRVRLLAPAREETAGDPPGPASSLLAGVTVTTPAGFTSLLGNKPNLGLAATSWKPSCSSALAWPR
jgi:hypothetical protein